MSYDRPDSGEGFKPSEHPEWMGQVFLVWPTSEETVTFRRDDGGDDPTLIVTADVAIITVTDPATGKPVFLKGAKIGGKAMAGTIRPNKPNRKILARLASRVAPKGRAYYLDVPDSSSPEWAQMVSIAEQYEAQHPRQAYSAPDNERQAAWQQTGTAPQTTSWNAGGGAPGPSPATPPPSASPAGTQAWNGANSAPAPGAAAQAPAWGATQPAAPAPAPAQWTPSNGVETWPPGLADFLASRGYDVNQIPDEAAARQLAATLT